MNRRHRFPSILHKMRISTRLQMPVAVTIRPIVRLLSWLTPKSQSVVVRTFPDFDDTLRAMVPGLLARRNAITVLTNHPRPRPAWLAGDVELLPAHSLRGFFRYLRAKEIYYTHGLYTSPRPTKDHVIVNLWHGMPIKRIDRYTNQAPPPAFSFSVATSDPFAKILAKSFEVVKADIEIIGLPRNDILSRSDLPDSRKVLRQYQVSRYAMMLPTFRTFASGLARHDGDEATLAVTTDHSDQLASFLATVDMVLLIKPHPISPSGLFDSWTSSRTHLIDDQWLAARGLTLYGVLGGASLLITDYSSVAVDFLATGRPCILYQPDARSYRESRGLSLPEEMLECIGPRVESPARLLEELASTAQRNFERPPRSVTGLWDVPPDGATERTLAAVDRRRHQGPPRRS
jgi:CDP-glycerol glycerophosphotransferase (TagB/SpsB family)